MGGVRVLAYDATAERREYIALAVTPARAFVLLAPTPEASRRYALT